VTIATDHSGAVGPPWIGPITPRSTYEHQWFVVYLALMASAVVYFGWRGLMTVLFAATVTVVIHVLIALVVALVRRHGLRHPLSLVHVINIGLLLGLTLSVRTENWRIVLLGAVTGAAIHVMGPTRGLRIHPVAVAQMLLLGMALFWGGSGGGAVLAPSHLVVGDVYQATPQKGVRWLAQRVEAPYDAVYRDDPQRVMQRHQHEMLRQPGRLVRLLRPSRTPATSLAPRRDKLAPLFDVLLGATPGGVGVTGRFLLIVCGLYLMFRRVGRWPMALIAWLMALLTLLLLPITVAGETSVTFMRFPELGWRVAVAYLSYQLIASPLLLIVLIMAPMTMPRTGAGRAVYAVLLGAGVVTLRWFFPYDGVAFAALILVGLLCPLLDRLRGSPFVRGGQR